ncbi:hypothetical protein EYF80_016328 [Liparis tanakae]|uniref:Uncharacterized protein n=1 Tax=Liparis tanakae TaxID=230148 RepID=A0A4Z2I7S4_9TELE|nr:hypothetical protein EYF80_016328 [Liparis tanakae]
MATVTAPEEIVKGVIGCGGKQRRNDRFVKDKLRPVNYACLPISLSLNPDNPGQTFNSYNDITQRLTPRRQSALRRYDKLPL